MLLPEQDEVPQETTTSKPVPRPLTEREAQILDLMRKGRKNREIGYELCIAESTVHKHVQNIFEKLHARNRTEAIYFTHIEEHRAYPINQRRLVCMGTRVGTRRPLQANR